MFLLTQNINLNLPSVQIIRFSEIYLRDFWEKYLRVNSRILHNDEPRGVDDAAQCKNK